MMIKRIHFPEELQKKFKVIELDACLGDDFLFFKARRISGAQDECDDAREAIINFYTNRESRVARKVYEKAVP